jgi:hypothetical protein
MCLEGRLTTMKGAGWGSPEKPAQLTRPAILGSSRNHPKAQGGSKGFENALGKG